MGGEAKLVEVIDNNFIDREVHNYKPTHVFIEALWVVPQKFDVLIPLHPDVEWFVRLHSNTPFISSEGIAMEWILKYNELSIKYPTFHVAANCKKMKHELKSIGIDSVYAPNVYDPDDSDNVYLNYTPDNKDPGVVDVGCFGAIRPLKNQLIQAFSAIQFAESQEKTLRFHINHTRIEGHGENVYRNLRSLFQNNTHELIEHGWVPHAEFIKIIRSMDLGMQVSFSETFNIVAADFAYAMIPCVGSDEMEWMNPLYRANPTDVENINLHMWIASIGRKVNLQTLNDVGLKKYNIKSRLVWKHFLGL